MSNAVDALKLAVELEKQALKKYKEAIPHITKEQTRQAIEKYVSEKNQYYIHKSNILVNGFECPLKYPEPSILSVFGSNPVISRSSQIKFDSLEDINYLSGTFL